MGLVLAKSQPNQAASRRGYWQQEVSRATKRFETFQLSGKNTVDRYKLETDNTRLNIWQDRYNILYSSTETTKPSLYAQTPKVQATQRHKDRNNDTALFAVQLLEAAGQYALEEIDFDDVMDNVVQDYLLPGMGCAWVRYTPTIGKKRDALDQEYDAVTFEGLAVDYVHYRDFYTSTGRTWPEVWWVGRRVYFTYQEALKRFGKEKADALSYTYKINEDGTRSISLSFDAANDNGNQTIIFEIWDKRRRKALWYSDDYSPDLLDELDNPLKLQAFFPCPRPIRAVTTTNTFIPKSFFSQYKAQQDELDNITERIRWLTQALRVVGVYDASQEVLAQLLTGKNNKMVPVQNWAAFASNGGVSGAVQYLPIEEVARVLTELYKQREIAKNEIYEITGFSDIVRGVSKASETLGAQKIKSDWAGGRLRSLQKEVQRFCRDIIRIMVEIISEQFSDESLALYAGFEPPPVTDEEQQAAAQYSAQMAAMQPGQQPPQQPPPTARQTAIKQFLDVVKLIRSEKNRCATIGIETDSTIQPDESQERQDRMEFLGQMGAFLQQAGPMALQYPDMRGLLGAIMMFVARTFRASRPIEQEFEEFAKKLAQQPAMPPPGQGGQGDNPESAKTTADGAIQQEQVKAQTTQITAQMEDATKRYEIDTKAQTERMKMQADHEFRMQQLKIDEMKLQVETQNSQLQGLKIAGDAQRADDSQRHDMSMDYNDRDREDKQFEIGQQNTDRQMTTDERLGLAQAA